MSFSFFFFADIYKYVLYSSFPNVLLILANYFSYL